MKHIIFLLMILSLFSCNKELDLVPLDSISDATFWKSSDDFKLAANDLYNSLSLHDVSGDLESDIAFSFSNPVSNGTYVVTETAGSWTKPYVYIRRCNKIITAANESEVGLKPEVKRFVAEARFFRAWNYWMLLRLYGGVPLIKDVLDINSEELYTPRASRTDIVDFILEDLSGSATDLPNKSSLSASDVGRVTKGAALALKARVALFEGTWNKYHSGSDSHDYLSQAISAANDVMNGAEYNLYTGSGNESYRYLFIEQGDDSEESILDNRYEVNVRGQDLSRFTLGGEYLPTKKLADMYLCNDGLPIDKSSLFMGYDTRNSEYQDRDPRLTMTLVEPESSVVWVLFPQPIVSWPFFPCRNANTGYMTNKYRSEDEFGNTTQQNPFGWDIRILRYAEVLLVYAEATLEKNGAITDSELNKSINLLRDRVGMVHLTNDFVTSNGLNMKNEIRRERTIELALEGYRYDDLRRWKIAETELTGAIKGIKIVGTQWGTEPILVSGVDKNVYLKDEYQSKVDENGFLIAEPASGRHFDPKKHYLRPLPTKEIFINDKLEQNPEW